MGSLVTAIIIIIIIIIIMEEDDPYNYKCVGCF